MRVRFTNTDSAGNAVTKRKTVQFDGEKHTIDVASTGTANVPEDVGEFLINSDGYAVKKYQHDNSKE